MKIIGDSVYEFEFKQTEVFTGISLWWETETNKMTGCQLAACIESVNTWLENHYQPRPHTDIAAQK